MYVAGVSHNKETVVVPLAGHVYRGTTLSRIDMAHQRHHLCEIYATSAFLSLVHTLLECANHPRAHITNIILVSYTSHQSKIGCFPTPLFFLPCDDTLICV